MSSTTFSGTWEPGPLAENPDFQLDPIWHSEWHVEYELRPVGREFIDVRLIIDEEFIRFDIGNFSEVIVWRNQFTANFSEELISFITNLFTCRISASITNSFLELTFLDLEEQTIDTLRIGNPISRILSKLKGDVVQKVLYSPLYGR